MAQGFHGAVYLHRLQDLPGQGSLEVAEDPEEYILCLTLVMLHKMFHLRVGFLSCKDLEVFTSTLVGGP